jgi:hypothetical protein
MRGPLASPGLALVLAAAVALPARGAPLSPPPPRGVSRVSVETRPFLNLSGRGGGGAISDLVLEHYFRLPFKLTASLSPVALGIDRFQGGTIAHARFGGAFVAQHFELGLEAGTRLQNMGPSGLSLSAQLRLGVLDGVNLAVSYGYILARNYATGEPTTSLSNARARFELPVSTGVKVFLDAAFSFDVWAYAMLGLTQTLGGDLTHASWRLTAGFGLAGIIDRFSCANRFPAPCPGSATAVGLALQLGIERRF